MELQKKRKKKKKIALLFSFITQLVRKWLRRYAKSIYDKKNYRAKRQFFFFFFLKSCMNPNSSVSLHQKAKKSFSFRVNAIFANKRSSFLTAVDPFSVLYFTWELCLCLSFLKICFVFPIIMLPYTNIANSLMPNFLLHILVHP